MAVADVLFTGGRVFTGSGDPVEGMAVAVVADRISAVIPDVASADLVGPDTVVVDLAGALLAPGFQDAHVHPVAGGVELLQCDLSESTDAVDAVSRVRRYAEENPDEPWILGGGWSMDHFPGGAPRRGLLDEIVPDRPVLLLSRDHHSTWVNTAAMRLAGVDAATADPADGWIEREDDGHPAGTFHEGAGDVFAAVRPPHSPDLAYRGLLAAQERLIALGITGWQDAAVGASIVIPDPLAAYVRAAREGELRVHVNGAQWWEREGGLEQVEKMTARRDEIATLVDPARLRIDSTKIMVDGVAENQTAAMLTPYKDAHGHETHNCGMSFIDPALVADAVTALDAARMQVHFHALGDRAVRDSLDAVEHAIEVNGRRGNRHHLAHVQIVRPEDVPRFAELDVTANGQPLWACLDDQMSDLTLPFLSATARAQQYVFRSLLDSGARLAFGSDWPVSSPNPLLGIHVAVNRVAPGADTEPLLQGQRLTVTEALDAYTRGSAFVSRREDSTGVVEIGMTADLAIVDADLLAIDPKEIADVRITRTYAQGQLVHEG